MLVQASENTKASLVLMVYETGAPTSKRQESMLVQASVRNNASLVLMVCETGASRSTSTLVHQGPTGADVGLGQTHKA